MKHFLVTILDNDENAVEYIIETRKQLVLKILKEKNNQKVENKNPKQNSTCNL
jgi:hypothetical protein